MNHSETIGKNVSNKNGLMHNYIKKQVLNHLQQLEDASLTMVFGDETHVLGQTNNPLKTTITLHNENFYRQVALQGSVGAAESYIAGDWDCEDLTVLIQIFVRNRELMDRMEGGSAKLKNSLLKLGHFFNKNTLSGSRKNIAGHYDLGNDLFELFLDSRMMYSSAVYANEHDTLEVASERKLRIIAEKLQLKPDDHLLEIGTGWGGFAVYAAEKYGCQVTTTTISEQQHQHVEKLLAERGLQDQVTLLKSDYRDLSGTFDKLVSIEMIEAVGHHYLPTYLQKCSELLKADGLALIQAITIEDHRYQEALKSVDFIKKYIFPGSFIPSISAVLNAGAEHTDLKLVNLEDFGESYAFTLRDWRENFEANLAAVDKAGYGKNFQRMWRFYFSYCEGGFLERAISDVHMLMAKPGNKRSSVLAYT